MSATIFLSRPGRCVGRVPLSLLVHKLTRYGEEAAAQALQELPLPFQRRRVWWLLAGNKLVAKCGGGGLLGKVGSFLRSYGSAFLGSPWRALVPPTCT